MFKDVVPLASKFISDHIAAHDLTPAQVGRYWLHQANQDMNELIAKRILGRAATREEAPIILDEFGNTASAGSLIAFSRHNDDLPAGTLRHDGVVRCRLLARIVAATASMMRWTMRGR